MVQKRKPTKKAAAKPSVKTAAKVVPNKPKETHKEQPQEVKELEPKAPKAQKPKPRAVQKKSVKPRMAKPKAPKAKEEKPKTGKVKQEKTKTSPSKAKPTKAAKTLIAQEEEVLAAEQKQDISAQTTGPIDLPQEDSFQEDHVEAALEPSAEEVQEDQQDEKPEEVKQKPRRTKKKAHKHAKRAPKKRGHLWLRIALAIIIVCLIGSCALLSWNRWFRFDDIQDVQGKWVDAKNNVEVTIDAENIHLTSEVEYAYELDPLLKNVTFSFAKLQGNAMYLFSQDRSVLYIIEGENRSMVTDFLRLLNIEEMPDYFDNERATILVRAGSGVTVKPKDDKEVNPAQEENSSGAPVEENQDSTPEKTTSENPNSSELTTL